MSCRQDYINQNYRSRRVLQVMNEHGDEMEIETIKYKDHWHAITTICQEQSPYKDYIAEGIDLSERGAVRKALRKLYQQAYSK